MAATKSQGTKFTLFMAGLTAVCAGIAFFSSGAAKLALILGLVAGVIPWGFFKIKPLEGKTGGSPQPAVMKLVALWSCWEAGCSSSSECISRPVLAAVCSLRFWVSPSPWPESASFWRPR